MRAPNQHTILSQGGKHGSGGTYLKGQAVAPVAAEHFPEGLTHAVAAQPGTPTKHDVPTPPTDPAARLKAAVAHDTSRASRQARRDRTQEAQEQADTRAVGRPAAPEAPAPAPVPPPAPEPTPALTEALDMEVAPAPEPAPEPVEAVEEAPEEAPEAPEEASQVTVPTSKRALHRMSKADAHALARELALDVPENPDDTTAKAIKAALADELAL